MNELRMMEIIYDLLLVLKDTQRILDVLLEDRKQMMDLLKTHNDTLDYLLKENRRSEIFDDMDITIDSFFNCLENKND